MPSPLRLLPQHPGLGAGTRSTTGFVGRGNPLRELKREWLPPYRNYEQLIAAGGAAALIYGDTTVDTDGTNLSAHTPSGPGPATSWVNAAGAAADAKIYGNEITIATAGFAHIQRILKLAAAYPSEDYTLKAKATFHTAVGDIWYSLAVRGVDNNRICEEFGWHADFYYYKYNNGTSRADVQTASFPFPTGGTVVEWEVIVSGTQATFKADGATLFGGPVTLTRTTGEAGIYFVGDTAHAAANSGVQFSDIRLEFAGVGGQWLAQIAPPLNYARPLPVTPPLVPLIGKSKALFRLLDAGSGPNLASSTFNDGTGTPFVDVYGAGRIDYPYDPTETGSFSDDFSADFV